MKIVRNGEEIELTSEELFAIAQTYQHDCLLADVMEKADEAGLELSEEQIEKAVRIAQKSLDKNDSYYELYWMTIECALGEATEEERR